jgi:hypothetical protein
MGIQINGNTDTITSIDGALTVSGAELSAVTNLNATGIVTATSFSGPLTGNVNGNVNSSGVSTITTLRATSIVGVTTAGITTAYIGSVNDGPISGARNRIINGDMRIDQRNAGASVTVNLSQAFYGVDRWISGGITSNGVFTIQQNTSAPSGFTNSTKVTVTTADSSISTSYTYNFQQRIEGFNTADLGYGTSSAKTITLSFWTRSSLTGTFGGSLQNGAQNYSYPFTYSISSVDTWEYKTITIPGPTSGTWSTDNSSGIIVMFSIGAGSGVKGTSGSWAATQYYSATGAIDLISTLNSTWYVTGVQLEAGTVATPFERRSFGQELALCQRYYYRVKRDISNSRLSTSGFAYASNGAIAVTPFPVEMRTVPTSVEQSGTASHYQIFNSVGSGIVCTAVPSYNIAGLWYGETAFTVSGGLTAGNSTYAVAANTAAYLGWSAEL